MNGISAEEWELISAFEVNPTYLDADERWPHADALFRIEKGEIALSFAVAPAVRNVRIVLNVAGAAVYELNAMSVLDVRYRKDGPHESVLVVLSETETVTVSVKPRIRVNHEFASDVGD